MPDVLFSVDQSKSFFDQEVPPHNRWHPDVPPVATVRPDATFRLECREWFDGTVHDDDSANDIRDLDLSIVHPLSGPIAVEGAQPGDLLVVDILELGVRCPRRDRHPRCHPGVGASAAPPGQPYRGYRGDGPQRAAGRRAAGQRP
jgi:acetamidase/formamidase